MSRSYNDIRISRLLGAVRMRLALRTMLIRSAAIIPAGLLLCLGLGLAEGYAWFVPAVKIPILVVAGILAVAGVYAGFIGPFIRRPSDASVARMVEQRLPELEGTLVCAVELSGRAGEEWFSRAILDRIGEEAGARSARSVPAAIVPFRDLARRSAAGFGLTTAIVAAAVLYNGPLGTAWARLLAPGTRFIPDPRSVITVTPGDTRVIRGDSLTIAARFSGDLPEAATLYRRPDNRSVWEEVTLSGTGDSVRAVTLKDIRRGFDYYVRSPYGRSDEFAVTVTNRPAVRQIGWRLIPPAYTGMGRRDLQENIKQVEVPAGTRIILNLTANKPLATAAADFGGDRPVPGTVKGTDAVIGFRALRSRTFRVRLTDAEGIENTDPIEYDVTVRPDEYPRVKILWPGRDVQVSEKLELPLRISLWDDYGYSKLELIYRVDEGDYTTIKVPVPPGPAAETAFPFRWDLQDINLLPDEVISYHLKVWDNDRVSGPKHAVSATYKIRLPSIYEMFEEVDEEQERQITELEEAVKRGRELSEKLEDANRKLMADKKLDWQQQKEIQGLMKRQRDLAKKMEDVSASMEKTVEKMRENDMMTMETMEKMQRIQQLMNEVATSEMRELMKRIQDAVENVDRKTLQQQMKDFAFSQKEYLEKINRTLDLLERIKAERKLDEAMKKTEELARRQEEINKKTETSPDADNLARQEEKVGDDTQKLEDQLRQMAEGMEKLSAATADRLRKAGDYMQQQAMQSSMRQMASQMQNGQMQQAGKTGQQVKQDLDQLAQQLAAAKDGMVEDEKARLQEKIRRLVADLLQVSHQEEDIYDVTRGLHKRSQRFRDVAEDQLMVMDAMRSVVQDVMDLAGETVFIPSAVGAEIGKAFDFMQKGLKGMEDRNGRWASLNQKGAMASVNGAAMELQAAGDRIAQMASLSQGAMMQQLEAMAQKQGGINQGTQGMMNMPGGGQGGMYTAQQQAAMARLAAEQKGLRQQLEGMQQRMGKQGNTLGDMGGIGKDMEKVAADLKGNRVSEETVRRQNRVFNRLLDYKRSLKKNDLSRERKAESGEDVFRRSPAELEAGAGEPETTLREEVLRALKEKYPRDYQELIRAYFKRLTEEERGE